MFKIIIVTFAICVLIAWVSVIADTILAHVSSDNFIRQYKQWIFYKQPCIINVVALIKYKQKNQKYAT